MIDESLIKEAVFSCQRFFHDEGEVRLTTQCLYPTNNLVQVAVRGGFREFVVSDMGGALQEASSAGLIVHTTNSALNSRVKDQGLKIRQGEIISPKLPLEGVAAGIILVANASKEIADWCFNKFKFLEKRDFRQRLAEIMNKNFSQELYHNYEIRGNSNKQHKFEYAMLSKTGGILLDSVSHDTASINSRVVANLDVRQKEDNNYQQFIVYDEEENWIAPELMLLKMAASIVPFSQIKTVPFQWK